MPEKNRKRLRTNIGPEESNGEIKRRTKVVSVFQQIGLSPAYNSTGPGTIQREG